MNPTQPRGTRRLALWGIAIFVAAESAGLAMQSDGDDDRTGALEIRSSVDAWVRVDGGPPHAVAAGGMLTIDDRPIGLRSVRAWSSEALSASDRAPGFERWIELKSEATVAVQVELAQPSEQLSPPRGPRIENGIEMPLVWVGSGSFQMGRSPSVADRSVDGAQRTVTLLAGFYIGVFEVRQRDYAAVTGSNPSTFQGPERPVESVSWNDAQEFCARLTEQERAAGLIPEGWEYRLPTEAEWEYACRAGTTTPYYFGASLGAEHANFAWDHVGGGVTRGESYGVTREVGQYEPNAFGLHDMHGNVWEWCDDDLHHSLRGPTASPPASSPFQRRYFRGGGFDSAPWMCRVSNRHPAAPRYSDYVLGFRVVLAPRWSR